MSGVIQAYQRLSASSRMVVQILSVIGRPVPPTEIIHVAMSLGLERSFAAHRPLIREVMISQVVVGTQQLEVSSELGDLPIREAVERDTIELIADKVRAFFAADANVLARARECRLAFYQNQPESFFVDLRYLSEREKQSLFRGLLHPFDPEFLLTLDERLQIHFLCTQCDLYCCGTFVSEEVIDAYKELAWLYPSKLGGQLADLLLCEGDILELEHLGKRKVAEALGHRALMQGSYDEAQSHYERCASREWGGFSTPLSLLCRMRSGDRQELSNLAIACDELANEDAFGGLLHDLGILASHRLGQVVSAEMLSDEQVIPGRYPFVTLIQGLVSYWISDGSGPCRSNVNFASEWAWDLRLHWLGAELYTLMSRYPDGQTAGEEGEFTHLRLGTKSLIELIPREAQWKRSLEALIDVRRSGGSAGGTAEKERLVWLVSFQFGKELHLKPLIQKRDLKGNWTRGRPVAMKRLYHWREEGLGGMSEQDQEMARCIKKAQNSYAFGYREEFDYVMNREEVVLTGVNHPLLFSDDTKRESVQIIKESPQLIVTKTGEGTRMELIPRPQSKEFQRFEVTEEGKTYKIVEFTRDHYRISKALGEKLVIPAEGREMVQQAMESISAVVPVSTDLNDSHGKVDSVEADPRPHFRLYPLGTGVRVEIHVKPFSPGGPYFRPGEGQDNVFATVKKRQMTTHRNQEHERTLSSDLRAQTVEVYGDEHENPWQYLVAEAEDVLELLASFHELGDQVVIEWPLGQTFEVIKKLESERMQMRIKGKKNWFEIQGDVKIDDALTLQLRDLLKLLPRGGGRFVQIGEGQFLALSEQLQKRLEQIKRYAKESGDEILIPDAAAFALEDLDDTVDVDADALWREKIERIRSVRKAPEVEVPVALNAELRDYQIEGFRWMVRLSEWGVGACLADDMGLGKTMQSLAILIRRQEQGPALVLAPTTVCLNWMSEIMRFAPSLNPIPLGRSGRKARSQRLNSLTSGDVVLASYGLLHNEAEALAEVRFSTIVLDEAQAIKNMQTKRSKAAMQLQGDFKVITTGTPIENHLGELWNLFEFINPGLLGTYQSFQKNYGTASDRDHGGLALHCLQQLIQPFILRRTKGEVLTELPPRTEVALPVVLGKEERAFYEALRQQAAEVIAEDTSPGGSVQVLAELMKLRRACCHPELVMEESDIESSKLTAFEELLDDLLENGHKALVFSQFVDHLSIVRRLLEQKGIRHQYLDGSTSQRDRKEAIDAFQKGQGDVFLISLKAGGVGLNLTAADYVIHMDPWWNPAVEDQASDRAHRMGQKRPVTIYRLVAADTIEEKIVELHGEKRDLATSLLEGTEMTGKMSVEELANLIRNG